MDERQEPRPQRSAFGKWTRFVLRWGIAVVGIWWVLSNLSLHDRVTIASPVNGWPIAARLAVPATEDSQSFQIIDSDGSRTIPRTDLFVKVEPMRIKVREDGKVATYDQIAQKVSTNPNRASWPVVITRPRNLWQRFWNDKSGGVRQIEPRQIVGRRPQGVPYPLIEQGLLPMIRDANRMYLLAAAFVFPIVYFITAWRWHALLNALSIRITRRRAFVLNMVGAFYNTFMPGSTGGDLLKAYYIAKQTQLRTRAVMSVIIDRILGLLALVLMGGALATVQFVRMLPEDPARLWCGRVALGALLILLSTCTALLIFYHPLLRKFTGLDFLLRRLPMQTQVKKAIETMEIYRDKPMLILWAISITLPVHATVVVSAMFAGMAFGLPLHPAYYWVVVPVVVLSGSIPISPQGAGVMEFFAILLTRRQGATVSQAFALTMSIRLVQMLWNLTGGIFVLRGGYHAPSEKEAEELVTDSSSEPASEGTYAPQR